MLDVELLVLELLELCTICVLVFFKARSSGESLSISVDSIAPAGQLLIYFWPLYIPVLVIM